MDRNLQIRLFCPADLKRILEIERTVFPGEAYTKAMFLKVYNSCNDLFVIAQYSRRIVGYVVTCSEPEVAQLISIAVDPQYRRKGVGTALMQYTLTKLTRRRIQSLLLMVRLTNRTALRFYRGFEFTRVGQIAHYYPEDGAAVRLQKILRRSQ